VHTEEVQHSASQPISIQSASQIHKLLHTASASLPGFLCRQGVSLLPGQGPVRHHPRARGARLPLLRHRVHHDRLPTVSQRAIAAWLWYLLPPPLFTITYLVETILLRLEFQEGD
jgi:hypothetical protein